ncbi:DUF1775 domain-containing protein [Conexibacter sp. JD483]|uniref:DUF1775 domain-containing protein n=1 Tax=unclassified Conexibacter TaxID=2627773 RepID=UPI00271A646F|nr:MULTISPECIES: DUF1775 domain-containing protein [unclassified Conexibacter]MDO8189181.1 DUF1775 domain-containing protein [Conexibacter sp. CPCC 205706]MDO8201914.1 DUF1775 domain-containing protein [Conexibacter sp. CPCC 205762]MDR9371955.1 DUF1775 domain-containing protein [Conexibacter sp. JD483]
MHRTITLAALAAGTTLLSLPVAAQAHVTVNPRALPAQSYQVLAVRVPNEDDRAATTKVRLSFPAGFQSVSYEAQAGWKATVVRRRLARPLQTDDGPVTSEVAAITWSGSRRGLGRIAPGQFREFRISVKLPGKGGDTLAFPALQTYSNGTVVSWTGAADADKPAPTLRLTAAESAHGSRASARAAHAGVVSRTPGPGARAGNVKRVAITFAERLITGKIDVYKGGKRVAPASSGPSGATVAARFSRKLAAGSYTVKWRAVAPDGHVQSGSWSFRAK